MVRQLHRYITSILAIITLVLSSTMLIMPQTAHAEWDVDDQHQLVPLYVYPDWWNTENAWSFACSNMNASDIGSTVIANSLNGPTTSRNTDYAQAIEICHDGGHNVIGYVDTSYGAVPLATVEENIDKWYDQYNGNNTGVYDLGTTGRDTNIDGIFLDQMSNFPNAIVTSGDNVSVSAYYREIFEYIKNVAPGDYDAVIGNPGSAAATDWQLDDTGLNPTQVADEIVVFEGPITGTLGLENYTAPGWIDDYPASDIAMLVYDVPSNDIEDVCDVLKDNNAGLAYVTSYGITSTSTPWNFLSTSTYWNSFTTYC